MGAKYPIIFILCLLTYLPGWAQLTLYIEMTNIKNDNGHVLLSIYNENQEELNGLKATIHQAKSNIQINDLKPGRYCFKYFHDENDNNERETNWMGIPTEGYGFSNNALGNFGALLLANGFLS